MIKNIKWNEFLILIILIFNHTCYSQEEDFTQLNEKTVDEFLTTQEGFILLDPINSKDFKIHSSFKETEFAIFKKEIYFKNGYPLSYYFYMTQHYNKNHIIVKELKFGLVESLFKDEVKFLKESNLQFEKITPTEFKTNQITRNEIYYTENGIIGENSDDYIFKTKKESILTIDKYPMLRWGQIDDGLKIILTSTYNIEAMINLFINDLKYHINAFKNNNSDTVDLKRISELITSLDNVQVKATFEEMGNETLAASYGINNDKNIIVKVNPVKWEVASNQKKWYIIYHELGHDVLNLSHGEGDKMMFNFIDKKYSWADFFDDRKKMFDIYCNKKLAKTNDNVKPTEIKKPITTVKIGNQEWTTKNLDVSKYRNGDIIPEVKDQKIWETLTTGAWCYYQNDPKNGAIYGKLYNWYAVNDPRGLAPKGFHIPTMDELTILNDYLGGVLHAGGKMKEKGILHWDSPNEVDAESSGFAALPGGQRHCSNESWDNDHIGSSGFWWLSTEYDNYRANEFSIRNYVPFLYSSDVAKKSYGLSVRCVRD